VTLKNMKLLVGAGAAAAITNNTKFNLVVAVSFHQLLVGAAVVALRKREFSLGYRTSLIL
jgi:hypothetical protein